MFKRISLLLALAVPTGLLIAGHSHKKAVSSKPAQSETKIVAWDIHSVLFTQPGFGKSGSECLPKLDTFKLVEELNEKGIQQVILSNISHKSFCKLIQNNPAQMKYFNFSGSLGDAHAWPHQFRKPKKRYYKKFLRKNDSVTPQNIIFFDDKAKNICGACKHGITGVQFCDASQARQKLVQLKVL